MWQQIFMGLIGLCSGIVIASGVAGLLIGLSIVPRYAGITRTADYILLYEDMSLLGIVLGNLFYLFRIPFPAEKLFLAVLGLFSGFFLGGWILALAEVADMFPILTRRLRLVFGLPAVILFIAAGKMAGSLLYYFFRWQ